MAFARRRTEPGGVIQDATNRHARARRAPAAEFRPLTLDDMLPPVHWDAAGPARFGRTALRFRHSLHERPLFTDAGLEEVLDRYPREHLRAFTMGDDPADGRSWRRGEVELGMTGSRLLEATRVGRLWLDLRHADAHLLEYAALSHELFSDMERNVPGMRTFKRDVGLMISSPQAQMSYPCEVPNVTLWGLRGRRTLYVYPPHAPFLEQEALERVVLGGERDADGSVDVAFDPAWDARAEVFPMHPGDMVGWRQNAPHRMVNGDGLNVSLSLEYMTPEALMRVDIVYANAVLRRSAGLHPRVQEGFGPLALAKFGLARAARSARRRTASPGPPPPASFRLGAEAAAQSARP